MPQGLLHLTTKTGALGLICLASFNFSEGMVSLGVISKGARFLICTLTEEMFSLPEEEQYTGGPCHSVSCLPGTRAH